jgi:hypothetical protein
MQLFSNNSNMDDSSSLVVVLVDYKRIKCSEKHHFPFESTFSAFAAAESTISCPMDIEFKIEPIASLLCETAGHGIVAKPPFCESPASRTREELPSKWISCVKSTNVDLMSSSALSIEATLDFSKELS